MPGLAVASNALGTRLTRLVKPWATSEYIDHSSCIATAQRSAPVAAVAPDPTALQRLLAGHGNWASSLQLTASQVAEGPSPPHPFTKVDAGPRLWMELSAPATWCVVNGDKSGTNAIQQSRSGWTYEATPHLESDYGAYSRDVRDCFRGLRVRFHGSYRRLVIHVVGIESKFQNAQLQSHDQRPPCLRLNHLVV